jgi:hypothetical protein
VPVLHSQFRW